MVGKRTLVIFAGLVWLIAGINILRIGVQAYLAMLTENSTMQIVLFTVLALVIFTGFTFMFRNIVKKNTARIMGYEKEKNPIYMFLDVKGYILMAFMMGLGIALRRSGLMPGVFFAFFYTGLGAALSLAGIRFWIQK